MPAELSYVLITPYTLRKGRYGAILARLLSRTSLDLSAAQILAPDEAFTEAYAALKERNHAASGACACAAKGAAAYIRKHFMPVNGKKQRVMLLVLEGENAVEEVKRVVGPLRKDLPSDAETVRDSFADMIFSEDGTLLHCEPAVLIPSDEASARSELELLAAFAAESPNIVENIVKNDDSSERTLVILKPENWRRPSTRPGAIMDIFTRTGLRLVGCKMHRISIAEALNFYGPVQEALRSKLAPKIAEKARTHLEEKFGLKLREEGMEMLTSSVGRDFADNEFYSIVEFMSGSRPESCPDSDRAKPGKAKCMVLIYEGVEPVRKIREVLGPTDSAKAPGGTVRGEFGTNMMVNAAHASDSQESFLRESAILNAGCNQLADFIRKHLA